MKEGNKQESSSITTSDSYCITSDIPAGVFRTTIDGKIISVNKALLRLFGYSSPDEFNHKAVYKFHSDSGNRAEIIKKILTEGAISNYETKAKRKDGSTIWISLNVQALKDKDGNIKILEGVVEDVSKRKETEQALREERDRTKRYLDLAGVIMVAIDRSHRVTLINQKGCQILGYGEKDIIGKEWFDNYVPKVDRKKVKDVFNQLMDGKIEPVEYFENQILTKNNETRIIAWHNTVLRDSEGTITGTLSSGEDITEKKAAEEKLKESEEKYRSIVELAPDGITIINLNGIISSCNMALLRQVEKTSEEVVGKHFLDIFSSQPLDSARYSKIFNSLLRGRSFSPIEIPWVSKDGSLHYGEIQVSPMKKNGIVQGFQVISRDITVRKQAEEELRKLIEFEQLIANLSTSFINLSLEEIDQGIDYALKSVGEFANVDRSYVFLFSENGKNMTNTHEWCARGIKPQKERIKGVFTNRFPWFYEKISKAQVVSFYDVSKLGDEAFAEKKEWQKQSIKSILNVPMLIKNKVVGFVGFDSVKEKKEWEKNLVDLLQIVGETLANVLQRKEAENALRRSEEKFRLLIENMRHGLALYDWKKDEIVYYNKAVRAIFGVTHDSRVPLRLLDSATIDERDELKRTLETAIELRRNGYSDIIDFDFRTALPNGEKRWIKTRAYPVENMNEVPSQSYMIFEDITERKTAEIKLKESQEKYSELFQRSNDAIFIHDSDGIILDVNQKALELFGYSRNEMLSLRIADLHPRKSHQDSRKAFHEVTTQGFHNFEIAFLKKNGSEFPAEVSSSLFEIGGRRIIQGIVRDVTERKKIEQQLVRSAKLASLGVLAGGIAHQINNPLGTMLFASSALKNLLEKHDELDEQTREKSLAYLDALEGQIERSRDVVAGLLAFAQTKRSEIQSFDVNLVVHKALDFLVDQMHPEGIELEVLLDPYLPNAWAEPVALEEVIINVAQNSFEAMKDSGKLTVVGKSTASGTIRIVLSDTGPGIPEDIREEIFEPLYTTKYSERGSGLGLSISAMLLERFGGRIWLEDTDEKGATFVIEIPSEDGQIRLKERDG